jgi:hypothetical protein
MLKKEYRNVPPQDSAEHPCFYSRSLRRLHIDLLIGQGEPLLSHSVMAELFQACAIVKLQSFPSMIIAAKQTLYLPQRPSFNSFGSNL